MSLAQPVKATGPVRRFDSDVDIDFGDRTRALALLKHTPAGIVRNGELTRHNTGIYVTDIPVDPFTGTASLDYKVAEERGYVKLDFLNVSIYAQVKSNEHLDQLMAREPDWAKLYDPDFCNQLMHINGHYDTLIKFPEAVNSIPRLAMFIAAIRPAKRHLIGRTWADVARDIWTKPTDGSYYFKKAHAVSYSHLIVVHMNLLDENNSTKWKRWPVYYSTANVFEDWVGTE